MHAFHVNLANKGIELSDCLENKPLFELAFDNALFYIILRYCTMKSNGINYSCL